MNDEGVWEKDEIVPGGNVEVMDGYVMGVELVVPPPIV